MSSDNSEMIHGTPRQDLSSDVHSTPHRATLRRLINERVLVKDDGAQMIVSKSGVPTSWIFDFRACMGDPAFLNAYAELFWMRFADRSSVQVCGLEAAGFPLVAAIVMKGRELGKDVHGLYLRNSRKKSGRMKAIEGTPIDMPVIIIDDLINSGQSVERAIAYLTAANLHVSDIFVILSMEHLQAKLSHINLARIFTLDEFDVTLGEPDEERSPSHAVVWKFAAPSASMHIVTPKSSPVIEGERVFIGSDRGTFYALNQSDGSIRWQKGSGLIPFGKGIFSSPAVHDGKVYVGSYDGNVYAYRADTGERIWTYRDADWIGSSPALSPDLGYVFIGLEFGLFRKHGGIAALSMKNGREAWSMKQMTRYTHSSPLYVSEERAVVIGSNDGTAYCFDAKTGDLRWKYRTSGEIKMSFAYDPVRNLIVFGSFDGFVYALDVRSGELRWKFNSGEAIYATPCVEGDLVFIPSLNKCIFALSLEDGTVRWKYQTRGRIFSSPIIARHALWIGSNDGCLYELDIATGAMRTYMQFSERITGTIAYNPASDRLFLVTNANELYCVQLDPYENGAKRDA